MPRGKNKKGFWSSVGRTTLLALVGANVVSVLLMLACGFSVYVNPSVFNYLVAFGLTYPVYVVVNLCFLVVWLAFAPRYVFISIVGLVIGFDAVRTYCPVNMPNPHPQECLKVMSYNIHGFASEKWRKDDSPKDLLAYVAASGADIICFQEYQLPTNTDHLKIIDSVAQKWPYRESVKFRENAMGIWSRYPILKQMVVYGEGKNYGSAAFVLKYKSDTMMVVNNHFVSNAISQEDKSMYKNVIKNPKEYNVKNDVRYLAQKVSKAGAARAVQADSVAAFIACHPEIPLLACGDFNDSPISYARYKVADGLHDAYVSSGMGPGISFHESGMLFRIDHMMYSNHWDSYSAEVDSHIGASDHYPIIAYFKLKND